MAGDFGSGLEVGVDYQGIRAGGAIVKSRLQLKKIEIGIGTLV